jgi:hypothetical protein
MKLRPWRPLDGEDDPLLMLRTMMTSAMFEADVPTSDDKAKGKESVGRRMSPARDRREL